ncbi:hypothetical protein LWF01_14570 [Saxibacter everestensis]|uniref:DUF1440 domain-containing protein n=1 Tax=Saxibacter everestensis TaxID=2909229 RepID=A0ABY8QR36_9MICO|nr:hypothetical protein LWF01_14570 [Brevibacteriaceae bacterium ZFBP1038]
MTQKRNHMLSRLVRGGIGGVVATSAMSAVLVAADKAGFMEQPPPRRITKFFMPRPPTPKPVIDVATLISHFGYGILAGAVFGGVSRKPTLAKGTAYGTALWAASYEGWIPALRIMPPAHRDRKDRALAMVVAHLVYGAVLAAALRRIGPRHPKGQPKQEGSRDYVI